MRKGRKKWISKVELPEDIITEILSRLPVKALLRFRCVCKLWKCMISNPNFILSTTGRQRAIMCCTNYSGPRPRLRPFNFYSVDEELSMVELPNPVGELQSHYANFDFLGSCNGLILFSNDKQNMYLWNPSTRRCSKSITQVRSLYEYHHKIASGLCFDNSSNEYKVVFVHVRDGYLSDRPVCIARVARLKKSEDLIEVSFPYVSVFQAPPGVLLNGHLHWIVVKKGVRELVIVYFDEEINQFAELPMPEEYKYTQFGNCFGGLTVLNGCLCMTILRGQYSLGREDNDVLVMGEYGVKDSWTKLFTIRGLLVPLQPKLFNNLVLVSTTRHLNMYNIEKKDSTMIWVQPSNLHLTWDNDWNKASRKHSFVLTLHNRVDPLRYMETLASVDLM